MTLEAPGAAHFHFIPGMRLVGMVLGYVMGSRAAREEAEKRAARRRK